MDNKSKILVPTDFSKSAENALRFAVLMADKINAEVLLLNVVFPDGAVMDVPIAVDIAMSEKIKLSKKKTTELTGRVLTQVLRQIENVPVIESDVGVGMPAGEINRYAKEHEVDFIFMGTRDEHGTLDKIFGSVASNVMKNASCPVMVIPAHAQFNTTTIVAYATDFSQADPYEIWRTSKLLAPFNPIIRCVHLFEGEEKEKKKEVNMQELESFFSENAPALQITFHEVATENKTASLLEFMETYDVNLLVMYRPKRTFLDRLRHRSLTKQITLQSTVPTLILKGK